jgi:hypothetical protein
LADRLRSLRNTPERQVAFLASDISTPSRAALASLPSAQAVAQSGNAVEDTGFAKAASRSDVTPGIQGISGETTDIDSHLQIDDQVLAELLEDIGPEDETEWTFDAASESNQVERLLQELSRPPVTQSAEKKGDENAKLSDESDSEEMTRQVENILSQALDEAKLNPETLQVEPQGASDDLHHATAKTKARGDSSGDALPEFSLPSVPSNLGGAKEERREQMPVDFEKDMAQDPDEGGLFLPSVPTSVPAARRNAKKSASRTGFTDKDMETWCVACLEDGTLVCPGCDDDVFCSRCWHDMHLGPSAGYGERFHKPKHFRGDDSNKRIAVGAS